MQAEVMKARTIIVFLLLAALFSGCSSSSKSGGAKSPGTPQNPEQSRGEARGESRGELGEGQQPTLNPISRGAINNEYTPGSGRLIVKLDILDNLISYESVSFARVYITPQGLIGQRLLSEAEDAVTDSLPPLEDTASQNDITLGIDAELGLDVALDVGDESARLDFGYVAFGRYILNATIYHSNGSALAYSQSLIDIGLADDTQVGDTQTGEAEIQIEYIRPSPDATDPNLAEYTATLIFDLSSSLFRLVTLPLVFTDDDNDGLLDVWHPAYLAAIADDLAGSYELTADLDLSYYNSWGNWQPLGSRVQPFEGIFVGNGHRISGLSSRGYSSAGLFAVVEGASITDLIVEAWQINASDYHELGAASNAGTFAGAVAGFAESSTLANITVVMNSYDDESPYITALAQDGATYVGGLVGRASNSIIANTTIVASGIISSNAWGNNSRAKSYAGGLAGLVDEGSEVMNVAVTGEVDVLADGLTEALSGNKYAGGLLGRINESRISAVKVEISGDIIVDNGNYLSAGGAVGNCRHSSVVDMNIIIAGNILAEYPGRNNDAAAAGVLGEVFRCDITNVVSETFGLISAEGYGYVTAGGVMGYAEYVAISNVKVTHHGDLLSSGDYCYVGGLAAYHSSSTAPIHNSSAIINGNIIAGAPNSEVGVYLDCKAGGMIGYLSGGTINSSYAIVNGDVRSYSSGKPSEVGGFVGSGTGELKIEKSYALIKGNLVASSFFAPTYVGGVVGISYGSLVTVRDSYVHILGNITLRSILSEDDAISYGGNFIGRVKGANFVNTYVFIGGAASAINIPVLGTSSPAIFGGAWGAISKRTANESHNITFSSSYYRSQREPREGDFNSADVGGDAIAAARSDLQLRCPQAAGQNCGGDITPTPGNPQTYVGWDENVWDFGAADELPRLRVFPNTNLLD